MMRFTRFAWRMVMFIVRRTHTLASSILTRSDVQVFVSVELGRDWRWRALMSRLDERPDYAEGLLRVLCREAEVFAEYPELLLERKADSDPRGARTRAGET
jgi:hypothetical protein